jgi:hypothetical protein
MSAANAISTGSFRLTSKHDHSDARPLLLAVPLEAPSGITTSANASVTEGNPAEGCSDREIDPDGHNWPVGRGNVPSGGADPRHK